jgi:hypothetical protein
VNDLSTFRLNLLIKAKHARLAPVLNDTINSIQSLEYISVALAFLSLQYRFRDELDLIFGQRALGEIRMQFHVRCGVCGHERFADFLVAFSLRLQPTGCPRTAWSSRARPGVGRARPPLACSCTR